jgi:hypothetical protein
VAVGLGIGAGSLQASLRVLGPLSTFRTAGRRHDRVLVGGLARNTAESTPVWLPYNTVLVVVGGVALTFIGQLVVGHSNVRGDLRRHTGPVQFAHLPGDDAPRRRILRGDVTTDSRKRGMAASSPRPDLVGSSGRPRSWAIALTLYLLLVDTHPRPISGLHRRAGPPLTGAQFGAVLTAFGLWQVIFYVALRGWPFAGISKRAMRLVIANITTIAAGIASYLILHNAFALDPPMANAVAGSALAAVLFRGMLFEGLGKPPRMQADND